MKYQHLTRKQRCNIGAYKKAECSHKYNAFFCASRLNLILLLLPHYDASNSHSLRLEHLSFCLDKYIMRTFMNASNFDKANF